MNIFNEEIEVVLIEEEENCKVCGRTSPFMTDGICGPDCEETYEL